MGGDSGGDDCVSNGDMAAVVVFAVLQNITVIIQCVVFRDSWYRLCSVIDVSRHEVVLTYYISTNIDCHTGLHIAVKCSTSRFKVNIVNFFTIYNLSYKFSLKLLLSRMIKICTKKKNIYI